MFGATLNYDTQVTIGEYTLSGIESATFQYSHSVTVSRILGMTSGVDILNGPPQASFNINHYLVYDDPLYSFTGSEGTSGSFAYNGSSYGFNSAYLTDYSVNCAVGAVPIVNAGFAIFGDFESSYDTSPASLSHPTIDIPTQGSISLTTSSNTSTNRVIGFDFSCRMQRVPHYTFNQTGLAGAVSVDSPLPIQYAAQVQIEVDDVEIQSLSYYSNNFTGTVNLSVQGRNGNTIGSYTIPNAKLIGEQLVQSSNGVMLLTMNYIGYTNV